MAGLTSEVEIVNIALGKLGVSRLASLDDEGQAAELARQQYPNARDELQRQFPWCFCTTRTELSAAGGTPPFGYDTWFDLPADYLRILSVNEDEDANWRIESRYDTGAVVILVDQPSPIRVRYSRRVTQVPRFDPNFISALSYKLAMDWAEPLSRSAALSARLEKKFSEAIVAAYSADSMERSRTILEFSEWVDARRMGVPVREPKLSGDPQPAF